jgi:hypothetical protein
MINKRLIGLASGLLFSAAVVHGAPVCGTTGQQCELPAANGSAGSWTASASGMTGIQCSDSVGPNGNAANSRYFFAATVSNLGSTVANGGISDTGTGTEVIGSFALNSSSSPSSTVTGGVVQQLLGGQTYYFYAQACPSGGALDSTNCSQWAQIGSKSSLTYPTSVFAAPVAPTDATTNSIAARTNVPTADVPNISEIQLEVDNLITSGLNQTNILIVWPGANQANIINDTLYTAGGGFVPNTKYQYKGQVFYPYGTAVPVAGAQTEGPFWTTPVNPYNVTTSNVTHCSVQITAENSSGNPPNPTYTAYNLCATGTGGSCKSAAIGGTPAPTDTTSELITGLNPNTSYTPNAQALVGNGDGTSSGWNSSAIINGTAFITLSWGGTFVVNNVTNTSANFVISGLTGASSIASWQILLNGSVAASGSGDPTGTHTLSSLTPNTPYSVQITLTETSGCQSTLPTTAIPFTTTPYAPTAGTATALSATSIQANWTDASANPTAGTSYLVNYCLDAGFSTGCKTATVPKVAGSAQTTTITGLTEETSYYFEVKTLNATQPAGANNADSAYFVFTNNPTTTLNAAPVVPAPSCVAGSSNTFSCTVSGVQDNDLTDGIGVVYDWTVTPSSQVANINPSQPESGCSTSASNTITVTYNSATTSYTVKVTVTDHCGAGLATSASTNFNPSQIPSGVTVSPKTANLATGNNQNFDATVIDQNGVVIPNAAVTWSLTGTCGTFTPTVSSYTILTATAPGSCTLTGTSNGFSGSASISVVAAGPYFTTNPALTLNSDNMSGTATAAGNDNVYGPSSINYTWSFVSGPAQPIFGATNGTNAAKTLNVVFTQAGTYTLACTLDNGHGGTYGPTSTNPLLVPSIATTITINPSNITVQAFSAANFVATALDQFGTNMGLAQNAFTWAVTGPGAASISAGAFSSGVVGQNYRITANYQAAKPGVAFATVVSYDVSNGHAFPTPWKSNMNSLLWFSSIGTNNTKIRVYTTSGHEVFSVELPVSQPCPNTDTAEAGQNECFGWNVQNNSGENLASGVYFFVIESPNATKKGKLIIIQ